MKKVFIPLGKKIFFVAEICLRLLVKEFVANLFAYCVHFAYWVITDKLLLYCFHFQRNCVLQTNKIILMHNSSCADYDIYSPSVLQCRAMARVSHIVDVRGDTLYSYNFS